MPPRPEFDLALSGESAGSYHTVGKAGLPARITTPVDRDRIGRLNRGRDVSSTDEDAGVIWWIVIPAVIVAALAHAFWDHRKHSRLLVGLYTPLATTYGGSVKAASFLALPQLRFARGGGRYMVGAMATAGTRVSGSASRPGFTGPFTFAHVDLPRDTGQDLNVLKTDRLDRAMLRLATAVSGGREPTSGDGAFDRAFRVTANDQGFVDRVLDPTLRQKLLDAPYQRIEVAVAGIQVRVHIDGYVKTVGDLDGMMEITTRLADNCLAS